MSLFARYQDAALWLGLGFFSFAALRIATRQLHHVRKVTEVSGDTAQSHIVDQETEDALKLDTLCKLAEGSSFDLRDAALKIICERSATGPTLGLLLQNVASCDPQTRSEAIVALLFLATSAAAPKINTLGTFSALTTCLCHTLRDPTRGSLPQRPPTERNALFVLVRLLPYNVPLALKAGLVHRWLAHYPFGNNEAQTRAAIRKYRTYNIDDTLMSEVICTLENHPEARKQMRQVGLTGSSMGEDEDGDELMVDGEETAGFATARRPREESTEERMVRRRRREAMVLSDGAQPLGRDDIIQRDLPRDEGPVRDDEVEAELQQLMDRFQNEQRADWSTQWRAWIPWS
ncbi:MAG: hypothetical protein M1833_002458 [Piccolia ochrophora]|nr:MAG: hypothetical protein M1833_002458 [Piccolia ochrophora]